MVVEVELRSFITKKKYEELIKYFSEEGEFVKKDYQITYYFDCEEDLRIQKNNYCSKIWMKKGKLHDEHREEIELKLDREDFEKLENLFSCLGYNISVKWFRNRHVFKWRGTSVMLDYSKGYGYIIEVEKLCDENSKEKELELLRKNFDYLNIPITPRREFEKKFEHYQDNWEKLV